MLKLSVVSSQLGEGNGKPEGKKDLRQPFILFSIEKMKVERVKYVIWAANLKRAVRFYCEVFGGKAVKESEVMGEVVVSGATIGIHSGGQGERTWTGLTFQVEDVVAGAQEVRAGGGNLSREPQPEGDEPPHLAMCIDPEGNEFMLTRKRGK
jgi:lactoylglutathione lyase